MTEAVTSLSPHNDYIAKLISEAPPLTEETLERVTRVLRGAATR